MTPRELSREHGAARTRQQRDYQRDVFLAWQTAAFVGSAFVGKLPAFKVVLLKIDAGRQSFDQMKSQLAALSHVTGFPLKEIRH